MKTFKLWKEEQDKRNPPSPYAKAGGVPVNAKGEASPTKSTKRERDKAKDTLAKWRKEPL